MRVKPEILPGMDADALNSFRKKVRLLPYLVKLHKWATNDSQYFQGFRNTNNTNGASAI
jgi:hypothetical protein